MDSALVIGGTRFIGRHTVTELLDHDYEVTIFNRGEHENPFEDTEGVTHVEGDRSNDSALEAARDRADPDAVFDFVAYEPKDVHAATSVFRDVDAYVYVSSGAVYARDEIPKREGLTPIHEYHGPEEAELSENSYGVKKAGGDRAVFEAAGNGVNAMSVRPTVVYGPYDYTERMDYWIDRVANYGQFIVPGDGTNVWQRVYVEDVASALRVVAEEGEAGEAYNVGDQRALTLAETVETIADALDAEVDPVFACERELASMDRSLGNFILYRDYPHVLDVNKLMDLGWESTPVDEAMARTVEESLESDRDGSKWDPGRDLEERLIEVLDTVE